jgi:hypothetical protein
VAAPISRYVARSWREAVPVALALSGAACLLERAGRSAVVVEPVGGSVERGGHGMLRAETSGARLR